MTTQQTSKITWDSPNVCAPVAAEMTCLMTFDEAVEAMHTDHTGTHPFHITRVLNAAPNAEFVGNFETGDRPGPCGGAPTVAEFARTHDNGSYFIITPSHSTGVIDGEIIDDYSDRRHVQKAWRIGA